MVFIFWIIKNSNKMRVGESNDGLLIALYSNNCYMRHKGLAIDANKAENNYISFFYILDDKIIVILFDGRRVCSCNNCSLLSFGSMPHRGTNA